MSNRSGSEIAAAATGALCGLAYFGYPMVLELLAPQAPPPPRRRVIYPDGTPVTVVIPAHNEERTIAAKVEDVFAQRYRGRLQVVVVADGCDDRTTEVVEGLTLPVTLVRRAQRAGKAAALNAGFAVATGEIVVFTDAGGMLDDGCLEHLVDCFDDPQVAVAGGRKRPVGGGANGKGESAYWRYEGWLKRRESRLGVVVGVDGGVFAVRRETFRPVPSDVYADDYWVPLDALRRGYRVVHCEQASVTDAVSADPRGEFERRSRISAGIWKESLAHAELLVGGRRTVRMAFAAHRVLRTIVLPAAMAATAAITVAEAPRSRRARRLLAAEAALGVLAAKGATRPTTLSVAVYQFTLMNAAALNGGLRHLRRSQTPLWEMVERSDLTTTTVESRERVRA